VNRVDGVILGVGVVVLVASIIGVILYDEEGGNEFTITWGDGSPIALEEQTASGTSASFTFMVNQTRVAHVDALVEATANGLRLTDDGVTVSLSGPGGVTGSCDFSMGAGASGAGSCTAAGPVEDAPESSAANGATAADAEAAARDSFTGTMGQGEWAVTVTITPGTGPPVGGASYTVILTPQVVQWEPSAAPPATDAV
jgi:hypothetical protein